MTRTTASPSTSPGATTTTATFGRCKITHGGTIFTLSHELGHYYQYLNRVSLTPRGIEWQATYYAHRVQEAYYDAEWDEMDEWAEERADES